MTEQKIQQQILLALGARADLCRLWRINAGSALSFDGKRALKGAPPGHSDLCGILVDGRWLGIEVKSAKGKQTKQQPRFETMVKRFGGVYLLVHSVEEAITGVELALTRRVE
jgi:hypothetical protein